MHRALKIFSAIFLAAALIYPAAAWAAQTPEDTVKEIVGRLKENGDPGIVLEYVSWEDAFKETPPQVRQSLGVSDAAGLKSQTQRLMAQPAQYVREKMAERIATLPPDQQAMMSSQLDTLTKKVEDEFADMKVKLKRTDFKVGKSDIKGDTAMVDISATIDGTTQDSQLKLLKRDEKWLLASPEFGKREQGKPGFAGPGNKTSPPANQSIPPQQSAVH